MHSLYGNTVLELSTNNQDLVGTVMLSLAALIPPPKQPQPHLCIDKHTLLKLRPSKDREPSPAPPQTTPLPFTQPRPSCSKRSGRRVRFKDPQGNYISYRSRKARAPGPHLNSRIKNSNLVSSRTPPPRGVPGALRANEECTPAQGGANVVARGTGRKARRRAYRQWRRHHNQGLDRGADSPGPLRLESTKATPKRSKWFQQTLHWQEGAPRRKKPTKAEPRTTPPLSYNSKLRVGALNVQGLADT